MDGNISKHWGPKKCVVYRFCLFNTDIRPVLLSEYAFSHDICYHKKLSFVVMRKELNCSPQTEQIPWSELKQTSLKQNRFWLPWINPRLDRKWRGHWIYFLSILRFYVFVVMSCRPHFIKMSHEFYSNLYLSILVYTWIMYQDLLCRKEIKGKKYLYKNM